MARQDPFLSVVLRLNAKPGDGPRPAADFLLFPIVKFEFDHLQDSTNDIKSRTEILTSIAAYPEPS
jgi:hypothetical protein